MIRMTTLLSLLLLLLLLFLLLLLLLLTDRRLQDAQDEILTGRHNPRDLSALPEKSFLLAAIHPAAETATLEIKSWIPLASPPSWTAT